MWDCYVQYTGYKRHECERTDHSNDPYQLVLRSWLEMNAEVIIGQKTTSGGGGVPVDQVSLVFFIISNFPRIIP